MHQSHIVGGAIQIMFTYLLTYVLKIIFLTFFHIYAFRCVSDHRTFYFAAAGRKLQFYTSRGASFAHIYHNQSAAEHQPNSSRHPQQYKRETFRRRQSKNDANQKSQTTCTITRDIAASGRRPGHEPTSFRSPHAVLMLNKLITELTARREISRLKCNTERQTTAKTA